MEKILIIEDDETIAQLIADHFLPDGYQVFREGDGLSGIQSFESTEPDLVILDLILPYMDGFSVCRKIRKKSSIPIIMLTARTEVDDQLMGYEAQADEYMTKPFHPEVLVAKAKALLDLYSRRPTSSAIKDKETLCYHGLLLDQLGHRVQIDGKEIGLEPKQFEILRLLMMNRNIVFSREKLISTIWGYDFDGSERVVDSHIKKLRKELNYKAYMIVTVPSVGYRFEAK